MVPFAVTLLLSAVIIAVASGLAKQNPVLAGFITALPLSSILALTATYLQTGDAAATSRYATAILVAVPASLLFFVPFLFYPRFKGHFWLYLVSGILLLTISHQLHRFVMARILGR
jgi:hypothetical protein